MKATPIILIIGAGALGYYFYNKNKTAKEKAEQPEPQPEEIKPKEQKKTPKKTKKINPPITPINQIKVNGQILATKNPSALKNKLIYAQNDNSNIYNYQSNKIGTTIKNELLGNVIDLDRSSSGIYILRYKTPTGQFNKISSQAVYLFN